MLTVDAADDLPALVPSGVPSSGVPSSGVPSSGVPSSLVRAGLLVVVEGAALTLLAIGYAVSGVVGQPEDRLGTVLAAALALLVGAVLVPVGRGLARGRSWALSPTIVVQLLLGVVGVGLFQGGVLAVGVPILLAVAAVLYLLATPQSRAVFRGSS